MDELSMIQHNVAEEIADHFIDEINKIEKELKHYKDLVDELTVDIFSNDLGSAVKTLRQYGIEEEL